MTHRRATRGTGDSLQRVELSIYVLAGVVGVVGTATLVTSVVEVHERPLRELLVLSGLVWLAAWIVLLVRDRRGRRLLADHDADQRLLQSLFEARRAVLRNDDPRQALVEGVVSVTGAALSMLMEVEGDHLVVTAGAGARVTGLTVPLDRPSVSRQVLFSGRAMQIADIHREETQTDTLAHLEDLIGHHMHSVAYVPIKAGGEVVGVICACFSVDNIGLADQAVSILTLLGDEAGIAIERERLLLQLDRLSMQDPLTGLLNRRGWSRALDGLGRDTAVVAFDLDHFKRLNDTAGHAAGDQVLQRFARTLADVCRHGDTVARTGGEEFAVLSPDRGQMTLLVDRLRAAWAATDPPVTFSAGIAYREVAETADDLQQRADQALYAAKRQGRNRTVEARARAPRRTVTL